MKADLPRFQWWYQWEYFLGGFSGSASALFGQLCLLEAQTLLRSTQQKGAGSVSGQRWTGRQSSTGPGLWHPGCGWWRGGWRREKTTTTHKNMCICLTLFHRWVLLQGDFTKINTLWKQRDLFSFFFLNLLIDSFQESEICVKYVLTQKQLEQSVKCLQNTEEYSDLLKTFKALGITVLSES